MTEMIKSFYEVLDNVNTEMGQLDELNKVMLTMPADVGMAVGTRRPELLSAIHREMTEAEVDSVLKILALEMRVNDTQQKIIKGQAQAIMNLFDQLKSLTQIVDELGLGDAHEVWEKLRTEER